MDKDKVAKLVIECMVKYDGSQPSSYDVQVNMGSFFTNVDDMCFLQLEECTDIVCVNANNPTSNYLMPLRIDVDIPQQDSYEAYADNCTYQLVTLNRDATKYQSSAYDATTWLYDNAQWQIWHMSHKPCRIPMRPEVLQQKHWKIKISCVGSENLASDLYARVTPPALVFSVTK